MQVICLEDAALFSLVEQCVARMREQETRQQVRWLPEAEAMQVLNVKAKSTMQKLRDEGRVRFSQPQKRKILYDRDSLLAYLELNVRNTF